MDDSLIFCAGTTAAVRYAADILDKNGFHITYEPCSGTQFVLLDVPSLGPDNHLRSGECLQALLNVIPETATIIGGNLNNPLLSAYQKIDLLKDESYLIANARITAYCTLQIIGEALPVTFEEANILMIGWGRIGKALSSLLINLGANVTVASGSKNKTEELKALEINAVHIDNISANGYDAIINTAPAPILSAEALNSCPLTAKIDLASIKGLDAPDVIWARGLPGIHAPKSSGNLIARCIEAHIKETCL